MDTALPSVELSERSTSVGDCTHCINEGICAHEVMVLTILMKIFVAVLDRHFRTDLHESSTDMC